VASEHSGQPRAITSKPVAVVQAFFDCAAAEGFAGVLHMLTPDAVWLGTLGGLDQDRVMQGPDAWLAYMDEIEDSWERFDIEVERMIEAGDTVVAFLREKAHARHGGVELHSETAMVFKVRDGKIAEARGYLDRDEALRAVEGVAHYAEAGHGILPGPRHKEID
jgi:ketosteroid isomerase-like protein